MTFKLPNEVRFPNEMRKSINQNHHSIYSFRKSRRIFPIRRNRKNTTERIHSFEVSPIASV